MCVPTENLDVEATAGVNNEDQPMITSSQPPSPSRPPPPMPPQVREPLGDNHWATTVNTMVQRFHLI